MSDPTEFQAITAHTLQLHLTWTGTIDGATFQSAA